MGIMIPTFLNGDALEDKYRGFMNECKANPSSKQAENTIKKTKENITHEQGVVDKFFSWIKGSSAATEEDIQIKEDKINSLESSRKALGDRIKRIDLELTKKVKNQGTLRNFFNDTEEVDGLQELKKKLVERREITEKNIETLIEEIAELRTELLSND